MILTIVSYVLVAVFFCAIGGLIGTCLTKNRHRRQSHKAGDGSTAQELLRRIQSVAEGMASDLSHHHEAVASAGGRLKLVNVEEDGIDAVVSIVAELIEHNSTVQQRLAAAETRLDELSREVNCHHQEARTDALTGCANRRAFDEELADRFERWKRRGAAFSLAMLDLDHFKKINDTHGHGVGDEVLRTVGRVLRTHVRGADMVARYGGEEFAIIMPGMSIRQACFAAEALRAAIAAQVITHATGALRVTASIGVAQPMEAEELEHTTQRTDEALYAAKRAGRNVVYWHDGEACHSITEDTAFAPQGTTEVEDAQTRPALVLDDNPNAVPVTVASDFLDPARFDCDILQNLPTKTEFCQDIRKRIAEWQRGGHIVSVTLVQLANAIEIEKQYGSDAVASVLAGVANVVAQSIREMDGLARYEPTSLAVIMPRASERDAAIISERIRKAVNNTKICIYGRRISAALLFATAEVTDGDDMQRMLSRAAKRLTEQRTPQSATGASA